MKNKLPRNDLTKIIVPSLLGMALFVAVIFGLLLPYFHDSLIERKKETIKQLTATAIAILKRNNKLVHEGRLDLPMAQAKALAEIKDLHYGREGKDYFWINDLEPRMVMHPYRPDLDGKSLKNFKDPEGKRLFVAMVDKVRKKGSGFVPYVWQRRDKSMDMAPKLSHVRLFKPWGWIVGTGMYLDDVKKEITNITRYALYICLGVLVILSLVLLQAIRQSLVTARSRQEAEELLALSELRYRNIVEQVPCGIFIAAVEDGRFLFLNQVLLDLFGYTGEEARELTMWDVTEAAQHAEMKRRIKMRMKGALPSDAMITSCRSKTGGKLYCEVRTNLVTVEGKPMLQGILQDITHLHMADMAEARASNRLQDQREALVEAATHPSVARGDFQAAATVVFRLSTKVLEATLAELYLVNNREGSLIRSYAFSPQGADLHSKADLELADVRPYLQSLERGGPHVFNSQGPKNLQNAPASDFLLAMGGGSCLDVGLRSSGELVGVVRFYNPDPRKYWEEDELAFAERIADQLAKTHLNQQKNQAREELARSEARYKSLYRQARKDERLYLSLLQSIPDAVVIYNLAGEAQYLNSAFTDMFGYTLDEVKGRRIDFVPAEEMEKTMTVVRKVLSGKNVYGMETRRMAKDGRMMDISISSSRHFDDDGRPTGLVVILRDITENKKLELELRQAQKMEAVGTLASGIAHDFNNLLQAISGSVELLKLKEEKRDGNLRYLLEIEEASKRASVLVKRLLAFGRKLETAKVPLDLNQQVASTLSLLRRTIPKMIRFKSRQFGGELFILGDEIQLEQVLINLVSNAADAMPGGGTVNIKTGLAELDQARAGRMAGLKPGSYAYLRVSDTGQGMSQDTLNRIFEPFYTTKELGKGTGLGLAVAYGIVKGHDGYIVCASHPGEGTEFTIYLPLLQEKGESEAVQSEKKKTVEGGGELILVVDDERAIQEMVAEYLNGMGYRVVTASDGESALTVLDGHPEVETVILDIGMPGMGGIACLREMKKKRKDLKIVVASGYAAEKEVNQAMELGADGFMAKPYQFSRLLEMVQNLLADSNSLQKEA